MQPLLEDGTPRPIQLRRPRTQKPTQPNKRPRIETNAANQTSTRRLTASEQSLNMFQIPPVITPTLAKDPNSREALSTQISANNQGFQVPPIVLALPVPTPIVTYNFVNNELVLSKSRVWMTVHDPVGPIAQNEVSLPIIICTADIATSVNPSPGFDLSRNSGYSPPSFQSTKILGNGAVD
jgi:hypothetical protein